MRLSGEPVKENRELGAHSEEEIGAMDLGTFD